MAPIPGGQIAVSEATLPNGSRAGEAGASGSWTFTIKAEDGIDDLTVGGYRAIVDGAFTAGSIAFGPGRLSVTGFNPSDGSVTAVYEITTPHHSPQAGPQQRYGDFISADVVLTDKDGDRAEASLGIQIRDDETLTLSQDYATATAGGTATGNVITGGAPDKFTADGFGGVTRAGTDTSAPPILMPERGVATVEGAYGTLILDRWGGYTYTAKSDAPAGAVDHLRYWAKDGDGDEAFSWLHVTIQGGTSSPTEGKVITSPGPNSNLTGGAGNDTINASQGGDTITTGAGSDVLVLKTAPWSPHVVKDFTVGTDKLDFQALKNSYGGSDPVADKYIHFLDDGAGGTKVLYDWDGAGTQQQWPSYVLHLQGVSSQGLTWNALTNPGGAPPAPDDQPTIGKNPDGTGAITITVSDANISNGTSPDPAALVQRGAFHLEAADGVQNLYVAGKGVIVGGVFQAQTLTTAKGDTLAITGYDAATGAVSYEYTLKYAKEHPAPTSGSTTTPAIVDQISLALDDKDGDRANGVVTVTILDDKPITRDDTDTVAAGSTTAATGNVMTDASEGDSGDGDSGRDLRGADQANPWGLSSVNTGASNTGHMSNGQWTLAGQYGSLKLDIVGGYVYTPNAGVAAGSVDTFNYYLKDNDGTPPVTGKLTITFSGGGSGGSGQVITSPGPGSTLAGGAGADTITASQGGDTITGGDGADWLVINKNPWSPHIVKDFEVGEDKLDLSALLQAARYSGSDPVADKYVWLVDDGAGGTNVLFDSDGAGPNPQWPNYVAKLEGVSAATTTWTELTGGGSGGGGDPPPPQNPVDGQVITSPGPGSTLNGGAGADTLISSRGQDVLTGAGGADHFVFNAENWAPARITDFEDGVDKIDLRGMLDAVGYTGSDPFADGYLKLIDDGAGGTKVLFDRDAGGAAQQWPNYVFQVEKVAPSALGASDWIFQ
jgi:hypothetical protein